MSFPFAEIAQESQKTRLLTGGGVQEVVFAGEITYFDFQYFESMCNTGWWYRKKRKTFFLKTEPTRLALLLLDCTSDKPISNLITIQGPSYGNDQREDYNTNISDMFTRWCSPAVGLQNTQVTSA